MAYKIMRDDFVEGNQYLIDYIADTTSDVANLPNGTNEELRKDAAPGSTALIAATGDVYVLNTQHEWKKTFPAGGGN